MRRLMITAAALALLGAPAAFAEQGGDQHPHPEAGQGRPPSQGHGQPPGGQGGHSGGGAPQGGPSGQVQGHPGPTGQNAPRFPLRGQSPSEWRQGRWQGRSGAPGGGPPPNGQAPGRGGPSAGSARYRSFQRNTWAQRRFQAGVYAWPRGYGYRRWAFGMFLPPIFFAQNYWIYDYGDYGLPYPPPGCVWVRYGPDALLVDQYTGEIVQVIYGIFY